MVSIQKISQVDRLIEDLQTSVNFVLVQFDKTTHQSLESLRKELKKSEARITVVKNTLFEKAIYKISSKNKLLLSFKKKFLPLELTTALLIFKSDWSKGISSFFQYSKRDQTLSFKAAILDGVIYPAEEVTRIAQLPSKVELIAKLLGSIQNPSTRFVYATKYGMQKLVYILQTKSKSTN